MYAIRSYYDPQEISSVDNKKDSLRLTITEYNKKRDELSASLQTFTQGIGIATVAQNALTKQTEYLSNIEKRLTDIHVITSYSIHYTKLYDTNRGGRTCHAAIIARELGIPAIVGCGNATEVLENGSDRNNFV